jgi:hypothetical protein
VKVLDDGEGKAKNSWRTCERLNLASFKQGAVALGRSTLAATATDIGEIDQLNAVL